MSDRIDAERYRLISQLFDDATTGRSERVMEDLGIPIELAHRPLSETLDPILAASGRLVAKRSCTLVHPDGRVSLILTDVTPAQGPVESGHVVNGSWYLRVVDGVSYALANHNDPLEAAVNKWISPPLTITKDCTTYVAPLGPGGDYFENDVQDRTVRKLLDALAGINTASGEVKL